MAKKKKTTQQTTTPERVRERRTESAKKTPGGMMHAVMRDLRGWADALFFAFLLAMFIRTYVFELFMIPTGSMTPALIGDDAHLVGELDWDQDGDQDIIVLNHPTQPSMVQVHLRNAEGEFDTELVLEAPDYGLRDRLRQPNLPGKGRSDMILVNKFAYWFSPPDRGDIVVFKVPDRPESGHPFDPDKPVYIKRAVGLPGEEITLQPVDQYDMHPPNVSGRISPPEYGGMEKVLNTRPVLINGEPVTEEPFPRLHHFPRSTSTFLPSPNQEPTVIQAGDDEVYMFGDNQLSSSDSRYWGGVPTSHLRGKAILRYWPFRKLGFLDQ
ncbi:S26 family signal peptidase [bacterium]|nr:S26 family signal peptidase [bacterium]